MALARAGIATGASARNWQFCSPNVELSPHLDAALQVVLTDPQTSGGLLVACERGEIGRVMNVFERLGFAQAAVIGSMSAGDPKVRVD
jgi:selenide,water dikinase